MSQIDPVQSPEFGIQRIFIQDLSFEAPVEQPAPTPNQPWRPDIDVSMNVATDKLDEHLYQVQLSITVSAKIQEKTAFLVEVKQTGIFILKGFPDAQLHRMLGTYCPATLFPYVRELISEMVARGGFPPLYLTPLNFDALYEQQLQQQDAATDQAPAASNTEPTSA